LKINDILKDKVKKLKLSAGFKKYFINTSWLFFERIVGMVVTFFVGVYVARYLGPANFGLLSYAGSFVGLFMALATLGLDGIVVRELVKDEKGRDELLGTTFILKIIGSVLLLGIITILVNFTKNDSFTNLLIFIIAIGTIFQSFNVINFYFQAKVLSKYTVYAQVFSAILCAVIKLLLIYFNMGLIYFAIVISLQSVIRASGLIVMYLRRKFSLSKWSLNLNLAKKLLKDSWPLMLSGIAISIYMKIDQVMIKNMLDAKAVGNYAVAVRLSEVWYFIPIAITNSLFPAIINAKKVSEQLYYERLQKLYNLLVWLAIGMSLLMTFSSNWVVKFLFGDQFVQSGIIVMIYVWAGIFVSAGVISSKFMLINNYTKLIFTFTLIGAVCNIILNYFFIINFGVFGAALSTTLTYMLINYIFLFFFKKTKVIFYMISRSFIGGKI
jgi:O-antigen/teichoic acid export membrane protein